MSDLIDATGPGGLPPMVGAVNGDKIAWKAISGINYELLGYFLSCHLIIEHYLDEFLKARHPGLTWEGAKLTFGQRTALLGDLGLPPQFDCLPAIKHMNSLRNKLSHRLDFTIDCEALLPMVHYLQKIIDKPEQMPVEPVAILEMFTSLVCSTFAGNISRMYRGVA